MAVHTPYPLSAEHTVVFRENGFLKLEAMLSDAEVEDLSFELNRIIDGKRAEAGGDDDYRRIFLQMVNLWRENDVIRRFVLHGRIAEAARGLLGCDKLRLWHDHALVKLPGDSRSTPWHQDLPYWPMQEEGTTLSCWLALDDVHEENGCMHFMPRSHKLGRLEPINLVNPQDIFSLPEAKGVSLGEAECVPLRAGSCTFHDGRTFHFASANRTDKPRRALVVIYMADCTTYNGARHVVTDGQGLQVGKPLEGELFPVVAEAAG